MLNMNIIIGWIVALLLFKNTINIDTLNMNIINIDMNINRHEY